MKHCTAHNCSGDHHASSIYAAHAPRGTALAPSTRNVSSDPLSYWSMDDPILEQAKRDAAEWSRESEYAIVVILVAGPIGPSRYKLKPSNKCLSGDFADAAAMYYGGLLFERKL